jgi:hypothetical protein
MKKLTFLLALFCASQTVKTQDSLVLTCSQAKAVLAERDKKRSELTEKIGKSCAHIRRLEEKRFPLIRKLFLLQSTRLVGLLSVMGGGTYATGQAVRHLLKKNFAKSGYYSLGSLAGLALLAAYVHITPQGPRSIWYNPQDSFWVTDSFGSILPAWYLTRKELKRIKVNQQKNFSELEKLDDAPCITVISME